VLGWLRGQPAFQTFFNVQPFVFSVCLEFAGRLFIFCSLFSLLLEAHSFVLSTTMRSSTLLTTFATLISLGMAVAGTLPGPIHLKTGLLIYLLPGAKTCPNSDDSGGTLTSQGSSGENLRCVYSSAGTCQYFKVCLSPSVCEGLACLRSCFYRTMARSLLGRLLVLIAPWTMVVSIISSFPF